MHGFLKPLALLSLGLLTLGPAPSSAQMLEMRETQQLLRSPILTVDSESLFRDSQLGQKITADLEQERQQLEAEDRRIAAELTAEEKELVAKRSEVTPQEFRELADAFDAKVQTIRGQRNDLVRGLNQKGDQQQRRFLSTISPILEKMMREAGAGVILERRSVFMSATVIDVTQSAIERIDSEIGDGSLLPPESQGETPTDPQVSPPTHGDGSDMQDPAASDQ